MDKFELQSHLHAGMVVLAYDLSSDYPKLKIIKRIYECEYQDEARREEPNDFCAHCVGTIQFDDENKPDCLNYPDGQYNGGYLIEDIELFIKESDFKI